jgi:hypothetical protein
MESARDELLTRIASAGSSIDLASPFLGFQVAYELREGASAGGAKRHRLLTALDEGAVRTGGLDPFALRFLLDAGWQVRTIKHLHAKVSLVDRAWGLVGSGNLTVPGLGDRVGARANVELGVVLAAKQIDAAHDLYAKWWGLARTVRRTELVRLEPLWRTLRSGERLTAVASSSSDSIDPESGQTGAARRLWVKVMYHERRQDEDDWWALRRWVPDRKSAGRPSYAVGDELALCLFEPRVIAALYVVTGSAEFQPKGVRELDNSTAMANEYPWLTLVKVRNAVPLDQALPLVDVDIDRRALRNGRKLIRDPEQAQRIRSYFGFDSIT